MSVSLAAGFRVASRRNNGVSTRKGDLMSDWQQESGTGGTEETPDSGMEETPGGGTEESAPAGGTEGGGGWDDQESTDTA
jgi:hypothetical protein